MSTLRHRWTCAAFASITLLDMAAMAQPCLEWAATEHSPKTRDEGAIAYDSARNVVILFGGEREYHDPSTSSMGMVYYNDTWEWDGSRWQLRQPATRPSARHDHKMVYDSVRNVTVLVGGFTADAGDSYRNETWEWNGVNWSLRNSSDGPEPYGSLVFDPIRGVSLYLDGNHAYQWNGANWSSMPAADNAGPSMGQYPWVWSHAAAFDSDRDVIVAVISTISSDIGETFETWERNGNVWTRLQPAIQPSPRRAYQLYYHPGRGVTVLVGGYQGSNFAVHYIDDCWEWDGANWTLISQHGGLARARSSLAYDVNQGVMILYGGTSIFPGEDHLITWSTTTQLINNDLWFYDGAWSLQYASPSPRHEHEMVADTVRGRVVMFGGYENTVGSNRTLGDTWEWEGESWSQKFVSAPSRRGEHAMAFDAARGRTVLFGGLERQEVSEEAIGDTWEWDGATWQLVSSTGPAPRFGHSMAYDENRGVTVLYGGTLANNGWATDTWEWDGQSWEQKEIISGILGRTHASMAYDRSRGRAVLFGGGVLIDPPTCYRDTWEWTGANWVKIGDNGPVASMDASMAYNNATGSLVLFGGWNPCNGNQQSNQTWAWSGTQWNALGGTGAPSLRHGHSMAYDPIRHETVLFGGTDSLEGGSAMSGETKFLEPDFPLSTPTYEASLGCNAAAYVQKNRYLSFLPPSPADLSTQVALRVTFSQMPGAADCDRVPDFSPAQGSQMWVGPEIITDSGATGIRRLQSTAHFEDWAGIEGGVVHVADCNIVPCATYAIDAITNLDYPNGPYSAPLNISTSPVWGDIIGASVSEQLNGIVDFTDISASVDSFRRSLNAPPRSRCDLASINPTQGKNFPIDFGDIASVVDAFRGKSYPFAGPTAPLACP
jgi:hypothetical protein